MSSENYRSAIKLLPTLTQQELTQLRLRLDVFLKLDNRTAANKEFRAQEDWLLHGIEAELRRRALWGHGPLPSRLLPEGWSQRSEAVRGLLLEKMRRKFDLRAAEKSAIGQVAARALAEYIARGGVPLGVRILLARVEQVPAAIESAFPGYLSAGLLPFCWGAWEAQDA